MSLHKLTAGDGYRYLTRQVAAHDASERGFSSLEAYYSARGEAPGVWMGRGLAGLAGLAGLDDALSLAPDAVTVSSPAEGAIVTEQQMLALFGHGLHPEASRLRKELEVAGLPRKRVEAMTRLGARYRVYEEDSGFRRRMRAAFARHNRIRGKPERSAVPEPVRARIRSEVAEAMFVERYGRQSLDDRERAGWMARLTRQRTTSVAGFDLSFSPVKSVSALWAIAPPEVAEQIRQAHEAAVRDVMSWLENEAAFTRLGRDGIRQVPVRGLIAAVFVHRDSRLGDPDLHTHVAVSNKVQTLDGRWRALDGRPIHAMAVAASERYNTRLEGQLGQRLGLRFAARSATPGKRVVREIIGVPAALLQRWSARRAAIDERRAVLSSGFQAKHGRPPSSVEAVRLAQQATLETRPGKHAPRSLAEQRAAWRQEAIDELGSPENLDQVTTDALSGTSPSAPADEFMPSPENGVNELAGRVVEIVAASRATWSQTHLRAEAERQIRARGENSWGTDELDRLVDQLEVRALELCVRLDPGDADDVHQRTTEVEGSSLVDLQGRGGAAVPGALLRADGTSVYRHVQDRRWTSRQVLDDEQVLLELAGREDGVRLDPVEVELALLEGVANTPIAQFKAGFELNEGQAGLIRELTLSGARLQVGLAPAGTGKTTALGLVSQAWTSAGGRVLGLAPSAAAADVLRGRLDGRTDTIAKLLHVRTSAQLSTAVPGGADDEEWARRIGPDTLIVVDEAGMASTADLAAVARIAVETGASVRLIGDDQQLAAVGAGGVLQDVVRRYGAATLNDVVRFADPVEGAASLALRAGDEASIGWYLDHGRVHVGDDATAPGQAYRAWRQDLAAGLDSILLAPTHDLVTALNLHARQERLTQARFGHAEASVQEVTLADTTQASAGDTVLTTRNARTLRYHPHPSTSASATTGQGEERWVMNGDRWLVESVTPDGGLLVRHHRTGGQALLPAEYVREHVRLGYAATVHAGQGLSVDTAHLVARSAELTRQLLYVAMTRGRLRNDLYLASASDGDEHSLIYRDTLLPPTAADLIARVLRRDGAQVSATTTIHHLRDPGTRLRDLAARYYDALHAGIEQTLGTERIQDLAEAADLVVPDLTSAPAWPTLANRLARYALTSTDDAVARLTDAANEKELDSARDVAAVLDWRLAQADARSAATPRAGSPSMPWHPELPAALDKDPMWGPYLRARAQLTADASHEVKAATSEWSAGTAPAWADPLLALITTADQELPRDDRHAGIAQQARELLGDLAVWRVSQDIPDSDTSAIGPQPLWADERRHHQMLRRRLQQLLNHPESRSHHWSLLIPEPNTRLLKDPWWPQLAARLSELHEAGTDVRTVLHHVLPADDAGAPLPDEHPASALWWRIQETVHHTSLSSAEPAADAVDAMEAPRDPWWLDLIPLLGEDLSRQALHERGFDALEEAVHAATGTGWSPVQILTVAVEHLRDVYPSSTAEGDTADRSLRAVPRSHVTPGLTRHILALLADSTTQDEDTHRFPFTALHEPTQPGDDPATPLDPLDEETQPPADAFYLAPAAPSTGEHHAPTQPPHPVGPSHHQEPGPDVERARLLSAAAADFYSHQLEGSWAQAYLRERLGLVPEQALPSGHRAGYAPAGWTTLIDHLKAEHQATDEELVTSGLAKRARTGNLIDAFRDRLVLAIHAQSPSQPDDMDVVGFVARRHPRHDAAPEHLRDRAGPKYLNTAQSTLYSKGRSLFGLAGSDQAVRDGATLVLAEGPLDALAVTLAGQGRYLGIASLGTALTPHQAHLLAASLTQHPTEPQRPLIAASDRVMAEDSQGHEQQPPPPEHRLLVATDADSAGDHAAEHIYDLLTDVGLSNLGRVVLDPDTDPAQLLASDGASALLSRMDHHHDLASHLITALATDMSEIDRQFIEERARVGRIAARLITRQPRADWPRLAKQLARELDLVPESVTSLLREAAPPHARSAPPIASTRTPRPSPPTSRSAAVTPVRR